MVTVLVRREKRIGEVELLGGDRCVGLPIGSRAEERVDDQRRVRAAQDESGLAKPEDPDRAGWRARAGDAPRIVSQHFAHSSTSSVGFLAYTLRP